MKNLLIALGVAVAAFVIALLVTQAWFPSLLPAVLGGGIAYALLARRTMKKLEVIAMEAGAAGQAGDAAGTRAKLEAALALGKEQFLVAEQIHGQLGMLEYAQALQPYMEAIAANKRPPPVSSIAEKLGAAKAHYEKAWSRDWRAKTGLAVIHEREGRHAEAVAEMEKLAGLAAKEPLYWGVYTWICHQGKDNAQALQVVARGLSGVPGHAQLTALQEALSNQKRPDFKLFGEAWLQYFPDHITREELFELQKAAGRIPAGAQLAGANNPPRTFRPVGPTPPPPRGGRMPRG